ncbi:tRNA1(Val) (adenine(37)-N6)-methyltransferase [Carnobacteriaceae bacterium zg-ZUI240]|nr:tRNA1(Val) (adenine(37)-N6)-methyltransferase [Carnobacteriaceae bacterium zg-ZUI240]
MLKDDERLDVFIKEGIHIIQSPTVFSFSLDAVLLAHFAKLPKKDSARIVDACSGNGAVAFMLSAKTNAKITGIEYQERLVDMANRTIALNHLEEKVEMIHADYNNAHTYIRPDTVDVITCNPPYFMSDAHALKNQLDTFTLARHEVTLTMEQWIKQSAKLLKYKGKLFIVHRPERLTGLMACLSCHNIPAKRIQFVYPKANKNANIVLIEAIKNGSGEGLEIMPAITVFDEDNNYTAVIKDMLYGEYK